jgi:predicted nucleic acid-binding protein
LTPVVLDASVVAAWILPDERGGEEIVAGLDITPGTAFAPFIWWYEIRNIIVFAERKGRFAAGDCAQALELLRRTPVTLDGAMAEADVLAIARRHSLTFYDAAYVELAARKGLALASLDQDMRQAARRENIVLLG